MFYEEMRSVSACPRHLFPQTRGHHWAAISPLKQPKIANMLKLLNQITVSPETSASGPNRYSFTHARRLIA